MIGRYMLSKHGKIECRQDSKQTNKFFAVWLHKAARSLQANTPESREAGSHAALTLRK